MVVVNRKLVNSKVANSLMFNRGLQLSGGFYIIWNTASMRNENDAFKKNLGRKKYYI